MHSSMSEKRMHGVYPLLITIAHSQITCTWSFIMRRKESISAGTIEASHCVVADVLTVVWTHGTFINICSKYSSWLSNYTALLFSQNKASNMLFPHLLTVLTDGCVTFHYSLTSQIYQPQRAYVPRALYWNRSVLWLIWSKLAGLLRVHSGDYAVAFKS